MLVLVNPHKDDLDFSTVASRSATKSGGVIAKTDIALKFGYGMDEIALTVELPNAQMTSVANPGAGIELKMSLDGPVKRALGETLKSACSILVDPRTSLSKIDRIDRDSVDQTLQKYHYQDFIRMKTFHAVTKNSGELRAHIGIGIDPQADDREIVCFTMNIFHSPRIVAERTAEGFQILLRGSKDILVASLMAISETFHSIADFQKRIMVTDSMKAIDADYARQYVLPDWFRAMPGNPQEPKPLRTA